MSDNFPRVCVVRGITSDRSHSIRGEIADRCCSWWIISKQVQLYAGGGVQPQISFSSGGQGPPSNTVCCWTPQVNLPSGM